MGASGGGYAALLMGGRAPELWAGASAWVPISDLAKWHAETTKRNLKYAREIELSIGGKPIAQHEGGGRGQEAVGHYVSRTREGHGTGHQRGHQ